MTTLLDTKVGAPDSGEPGDVLNLLREQVSPYGMVMAPAVNNDELVPILQAYTDVTERLKRSHEALAREVCRLREELHEKDKELYRRQRLAALGEMAAGVAHEIRNPLGGMGLYASLLERDLNDRPKQQQIVRKLSAGIQNLDSIVGDILAFAGDAEPNRQPVLLKKILHGALAKTASQAETLKINLEVDPALEAVELFCDAGQIERALVNLILNAFDAAGHQGTCDAGGCVWIRRNDRDEHAGVCRMVVEDNGPGVAPALLPRVFEPFFTTKETGTGLGLTIVHRIAEANGGSISAAHGKGGGATFVLSVPLARECQNVPNPELKIAPPSLVGAGENG